MCNISFPKKKKGERKKERKEGRKEGKERKEEKERKEGRKKLTTTLLLTKGKKGQPRGNNLISLDSQNHDSG